MVLLEAVAAAGLIRLPRCLMVVALPKAVLMEILEVVLAVEALVLVVLSLP